ncbi:MAG: hypothetical protein HQ478_04705 [Chloroflexi bacterium]|nr:hypothetical protein [Chloroflexota bacterium]
MSIVSARAGIAAALDTIPGLAVATYPINEVQESPSVAIELEQVNYTDLTYRFRLKLEIASWDEDTSYGEIDLYLELTGTKSIHAVIVADPACIAIEAAVVNPPKRSTQRHPSADIVVVFTDVA